MASHRKISACLFLVFSLTTNIFATAHAQKETPGPAGEARARLVGRWNLVAFEDRKSETDSTSEWTYKYGKKPHGYIQYDADGHMSVQITGDPPAPDLARKDDDSLSAREGKDLYDGYVAYFGTFTVDEKNYIVIHHVEASLHPGYTGTDQKRPFTLSGDNLMLGDGKFWRRTFVRVR